jgi:hypothetical protein
MARHNVGRSKPHKKNQQGGCHPDPRTVRKEKYWKFRRTYVSVVRVIKTFVKIDVSIRRTATEGRFLRKGARKRPCINDSETRETQQPAGVTPALVHHLSRSSRVMSEVWLSISARAENTCDDRGCIHAVGQRGWKRIMGAARHGGPHGSC